MEAVASRDEVALDLMRRAIFTISDNWVRSFESVNADVADFEYDLPTGGEPRISEIFYDLVLRIDGNRFSTGEIGEIDSMTTPIEAQFDSMMNKSLLLQSVTDAYLYHQVDCALFEHAC